MESENKNSGRDMVGANHVPSNYDRAQGTSQFYQGVSYPRQEPPVPTATEAANPKKKRTLPLVPAVVGGAALLLVGGFTGGAIGYGAGVMQGTPSQFQGGPGNQQGGPGSQQGGPGMPGGQYADGGNGSDDNRQGSGPQGTGSDDSDQSSDGAQNAAPAVSSYDLARSNLAQGVNVGLEDPASLVAIF